MDGAGDYNVYMGEDAGGAGTQTDASDANVGVGYKSLEALTSGYSNIAIGAYAGYVMTSGTNNIAIGSWDANDGAPLQANTGGHFNIAIGTAALETANDDSNDGTIAIGYGACKLQVGNGLSAQFANSTVGIGYQALTALTSGVGNTAVGYQALSTVTDGSTMTAVGYKAFKDASMTGGGKDGEGVAIGYLAGSEATTVDGVTYVGGGSGTTILGGYNTAVGSRTLYDTDEGSSSKASAGNTVLGYFAMGGTWTNVTIDNCVAIGRNALDAGLAHADVSGTVAIGRALTTGAGNVAVGYQAGNILTTGSTNTIIGHDADVDANSRAGCIVIGSGLSLNTASDNVVEIGNNTNSMTYDLDGGDITVTSDVRTKKDIKDSKLGLEFINRLRPITYKTKPSSQYPKEFDVKQPSKKSSNKVWDGLIAQEVKEVMDEMNVGFSGWEEGINTKQRLAYGKFVMPLIKAVQELTAKVEALEAK